MLPTRPRDGKQNEPNFLYGPQNVVAQLGQPEPGILSSSEHPQIRSTLTSMLLLSIALVFIFLVLLLVFVLLGSSLSSKGPI